MSNRRRPTRPDLVLRVVRIVDAAALTDLNAYRCPDCDSVIAKFLPAGPRIVHLEIRHDATCPWLQQWGRSA